MPTTATQSARAPSAFKAYPPKIQRRLSAELIENLAGITDDAARASSALQGLQELLYGCPPGHEMSAGNLRELLEPICGAVDGLALDLNTLISPPGWHARAAELAAAAQRPAA